MKSRRKALVLMLAVVFIAYMILGACARRDVLFLMGDDRSIFSRSSDDVPVFGVQFPYHTNNKGIIWLDDKRCRLLWEKILDGRKQPCGACNFVFRMYGQMYIFPKWAETWSLKRVLLPFAPRITLEYTPSARHLYISEDCAALGYECSSGLGVSEISPIMLNINMSDILHNLEKSSVPKERYEVLYDRNIDGAETPQVECE